MPLMSSPWQRLRGGDLAIDLGTTSTLIWRKKKGVVLDEPSVLAVEGGTGKVLAAGERARGLIGRTPAHVHIMRPVRDGVIVDADVAESMLRTFIDQVHAGFLNRPRVVVSAPSQITAVERRALEETVLRSGAREVFVVEEAMAAAIGAGLPVNDERASMVLDIGGGTTDGAITALGGIVRSGSARVGGDDLETAARDHLREQHGLLLGERTAAEVVTELGTAVPLQEEIVGTVHGRSLQTGLPESVRLSSAELREALAEPLSAMSAFARGLVDQCPPDLAGDVREQGVVLTGGVAALRGIDHRISREIGVPVHVAKDPRRAVIRGAGRCIDDLARLRRIVVGEQRY
ncbi:rod shape-determining protein MreB [Kytococcus aerolatus]|uniref:Cell shape-determining protein MreB n=2 Tax=Kytococcus aerolatus TaxID=592308 RepID=A0A212U0E4_9MICO|nr:rod shape-determining protein MreB [Kytococcus aerolatus]